MRFTTILIALAVVLATPLAGIAQAAHSPSDPVTNGDFETGRTAGKTLSDAIPDGCIGVGHQVFWGEDTPQQYVLGDSRDPQPQPMGPAELVQAYADGERDPIQDGIEQSGTDGCRGGGPVGSDVQWITPDQRAKTPPGWNTALEPDRSAEFVYDGDGDPFDREVRMLAGTGSGHNLWQTFPSAQEAFTANFQEYRFTVEEGQIPDKAKIEVSLSFSPGYAQHPFVGAFYEGQIVFDGTEMQADALGDIRLDPIEDARFECPNNYPPCDRFKDSYDAADEEGKREMLGQTRLVQNSFWGFNRGSTDVVIDDISIVGATTAIEELADGNVNPNPLPEE